VIFFIARSCRSRFRRARVLAKRACAWAISSSKQGSRVAPAVLSLGRSVAAINHPFTKSEQPYGRINSGIAMPAASALSLFRKLHSSLTRTDAAFEPAGAPPESAPPAPAVDDALRQIPGILAPMLDAFGENGIRTVEDLAACATDDLVGWTEQSGGVITTHPGILRDVAVSRQQCDAIILQARIRAGWIEAAG